MSAPEWVGDGPETFAGTWTVLYGPHRVEVTVRSWSLDEDVAARELAERIAELES